VVVNRGVVIESSLRRYIQDGKAQRGLKSSEGGILFPLPKVQVQTGTADKDGIAKWVTSKFQADVEETAEGLTIAPHSGRGREAVDIANAVHEEFHLVAQPEFLPFVEEPVAPASSLVGAGSVPN
jgi:hypothetical protein